MGYEIHGNFRRKTDCTLVGYKRSKFRAVEQLNVCFNELAKIYDDKKFRTNNTATVCVLENKETGQKIIVASTHLHWNKKLEYVRMGQSHYLLYKISGLAKKYAPGFS